MRDNLFRPVEATVRAVQGDEYEEQAVDDLLEPREVGERRGAYSPGCDGVNTLTIGQATVLIPPTIAESGMSALLRSQNTGSGRIVAKYTFQNAPALTAKDVW